MEICWGGKEKVTFELKVDSGTLSPVRVLSTKPLFYMTLPCFTEKPWEIEAYRNGFRLDLLARFIKNPTYGDNVNLRCDSGGIPAPEITWYRQGIPLNNDNKYMISVRKILLEVALHLSVRHLFGLSPTTQIKTLCSQYD